MLSKNKTTKLSKFLSLVLRHKPETIDIQLDEEGWISVDVLLQKMNRMSFEELVYIVNTNNKKRFAFNEDKTRIRASQGHSIKVDLGLKPQVPPAILYHGTSTRFLVNIRKTGIEKRTRQQVHLSASEVTAISVGKRHGKPVVLRVEALKMHDLGHAFFLSENGVWLTDFVPTTFIK